MHDVPIGIQASGLRREQDLTGSIDVPADRYWGAGTQRALAAGEATACPMPDSLFRCYGYLRRAAVIIATQAGRLPPWKAAAIVRATADLTEGRLVREFPLGFRQYSDAALAAINVNEVLANRAAQLLGAPPGSREPIEPLLDLAFGPGPDAAFTAALFIAAVLAIEQTLVPPCTALARALARNPEQSRLRAALLRIDEAEGSLHEIAAEPPDATGLAPEDWTLMTAVVAADTGRPFIVAPQPFCGRAALDAPVAAMAAVRGLAIVLLDIAASLNTGAELPQAAALAKLCRCVIEQDRTVVAAASHRGAATDGTARAIIAASLLGSLQRLADGCRTLSRIVARTR
jgi:fumarate hydratase class II